MKIYDGFNFNKIIDNLFINCLFYLVFKKLTYQFIKDYVIVVASFICPNRDNK